MNCQKCNALIPDDSTFCPECGAKVETVWTAPSEPAAQVFCPNCGSPMAAGDCFCENCGAKVEAAAPQQSAAAPKAGKKSKAGGIFQTVSSKTKIPAKFLKLGVAGVALILVVVILVSIIASAGSVNNYALYIKDGEMYYSEMPKGKDPVEVTSKLVDSGSDSNYYLSYNAYSFGNAAYLTKDGKKLFYADKATIGSSGSLTEFTLYYRDITNAKKEPVKITSGISSYSINEKGTLVTYIKDGNLYQHNLKEQTKIASDVTAYRTSKDGKTLLYIEKEDGEEAGTLYKKSGSKEATKIAGDVTRITYVDEKLSTIMFRKDDSLYKKSGNKDAEKIASGIYSVYVTYEDGSLYYATTDEEEELTYWDFITDDMQDDDDYDYYRENLKENTISNSMVTLYYYNGKEAIEVAKNVLDVETGSYDEPVLVYQALEGEDLPKVKLSKVVEDYNAYELISEALADVTEYFVCNEKTSSKIDLEDVYSVDLSDDGKTAYVSTEIDNEGDDPDYTVTLYKLTLSGSKIKKTEKVDEDVYAYSTYFSNGAYLYFKDVNDEATKGELYMNGKKVDDDVRTSSVSYNEETKKVVYFVDWNSEKGQGTLKTSNGKKATVVKDDVRSYRFTPEGQVLYLYDYSTENYKGELWILNGSKSTKLDDDVVAIIPVYTLD